ncbi:MAG: alternative ribosome rescue aminoacyl-tRNA hydrolase ArfB [Pseudohongiellaceae bacterium]
MKLAGIELADSEVEFQAIRASGPGGQNVNKVSSAIQLRFDISASSLTENVKQKLLSLHDQRISNNGVIVIKAQRFRSQDKNRQDALSRLETLFASATRPVKPRKPTRPSKSAVKKRLESKKSKGRLKSLRNKPSHGEL